MSELLPPRNQAEKMPADAAHVVLWFKGLPQPTTFMVERVEADKIIRAFKVGDPMLQFQSYPNGSGYRSDSTFQTSDIRGVTIEYPSLRFNLAPGSH